MRPRIVVVAPTYLRVKEIARVRNLGPGYYAVVRKSPLYPVMGIEKATIIVDANNRLDAAQREAIGYLCDRGAEVETFSL